MNDWTAQMIIKRAMRRIRRIIHHKLLTDGQREEKEQKLFGLLDAKIEEIKDIASLLHPSAWEESYDRYYINDYLGRHKSAIHGNVLEFCGGEVVYAAKFGGAAASHIDLMAKTGLENSFPDADIYANIEDVSTLPPERYDCIIATQVIMYMYDLEAVMNNLKYMLKPGGTLLLTVPGPISDSSPHRIERYWSFSEMALKRLCKNTFGNYEDCRVYGSADYSIYMLYHIKQNPHKPPIADDEYHCLLLGISCKKDDTIV